MDRPVLIVATPVYGQVHPRFIDSLLATQALLPRHGINVRWTFLSGDSLVPRARNQLAAYCLSDAATTHIMWIDGDIAWQPEDVLRLVAHDVDLACGVYPRKTLCASSPPAQFVFRPLLTDDGTAHFDVATGLLEVEAGGTGFMLAKRRVFERMIEAYPESKIQHAPEMEHGCPAAMPWSYDYFPTYIENGVFLSEDYAFCSRWRKLGGKVWADPSIQLTHYGAHAFRGDPLAMFRPAEELVA